MFLLIGFSRIYLGVHYTTDVIAGFAAALIWILVVRFVEMQLARRRRRKEQSQITRIKINQRNLWIKLQSHLDCQAAIRQHSQPAPIRHAFARRVR